MKVFKLIILFLFCFLSGFSYFSQTLVINEVSNGPAGNQEYLELVVVDTQTVYQCNTSFPPCIDIRGWIIDDNSGYHGASGVAPGCIRFSFDPIWQCVPLGTIILIYNGSDPNINLPADDFSIVDNNCKLVMPISSTQYFEKNSTTPGAVACSYPITGWVPGGDWSGNIVLANTGDCMRLVDLSGCEVFSICYAAANQNTEIYFQSGNSGSNNVWFFNDGDPTMQSNWSEGCADLTACGLNNQTPGAANNALNSAYIAQFNNNCQPIQPLTLSIIGTTSQSCTCDGSANISASGSIGPYTYAWYDNFNVPLGQTTATATNLCSGNYYCVVTSSIDCKDTIPVFVGTICSNFGTFASATMIENCVNSQFYNTTWANLPDQINPNGVLFNSYNYGPFFQNSNTLILRGGEVKTFKNPGANVCGAKLYYTVYTVGNQPANPLFTILDLPFKEPCNVGPNNFPTGGPCFNATDQKWAKENYNIDLTTYPPGDYVIEVYYAVPGSYTSTTGCNDTIYVNNNGSNYKALFQIKPQPLISGGPLTICPGNNSTLTSNYTTGNSWSTSSTNQSITVDTSGTYRLTVNLNNNCPNLRDSVTITIYAAPTVEAGPNQTTCGGAGAINLNGFIGGSATGVTWSSPSGSFSSNSSASTTYTPSITSGVVTIILTATGPCPSVSDQVEINITAPTTPTFTQVAPICSGGTFTLPTTSLNGINGSWSPAINSTSTTTYIFTPTAGVCESTATMTITVNTPTIPTFNQVAPVCSSNSFSLPPTSFNGITGVWSPAVNTSSTTNYTFTPTIGQCANNTTMTVVINPIFNEVENVTICSNETPYLWNELSLSSSTTQSVTISSIDGCDSTVTLNLSVLPTFTTSLDSIVCQNELPLIWNELTFNDTGVQSLNLSSVNGCDSAVIMNVQVLQLPQISISGGGIFCDGELIQPVEAILGGSSPFNISYTIDGLESNVTSNQNTISLGNVAGNYVVIEISDQNCQAVSNLGSASIVINPIPSSPQVSNDSTYCLNATPDSLIASGNVNSSITWFTDSALSNSIQLGNSYYPDNILGSTTYYVVQEGNGCTSAPNEVMITFEICDIIIPTAFTPDGDNTNDFWNLGNIDALYPNNLVTIYNRWGNVIYQSKPGKYETKPWEGTYNQEPMPVGSYYFIIEFGVSFKGNESGIVSIVK